MRDPRVELGDLAGPQHEILLAEHQPEPTGEHVHPVVAFVGAQVGIGATRPEHELVRLDPSAVAGEGDDGRSVTVPRVLRPSPPGVAVRSLDAASRTFPCRSGAGMRRLTIGRRPRPNSTSVTPWRAIARNPDIRNLELGWTLSVGIDWLLLVLALVLAYDAGGPTLAGLVPLFRMAPATLVSAVIDTGRFARPERSLPAVALVRAASAALIAGAVVLEWPVVVFIAVGVGSAATALVRPTTMSLLPATATTPGELVSANVGIAFGESLGTFAGPLLAGLVVSAAGPAQAATVAAVLCLVNAAAVVRVRIADAARPRASVSTKGFALASGLGELRRRPPAAAVMTSIGAQIMVRGALTTLVTVLAIDELGLGDSGVGLLGSAIGVGGLVGAAGVLAAGTHRRLSPMFVVALLLWGLPIVAIGLLPATAVAVTALAVVGVGNALVDVSGFTLLQRGTRSTARSSVFSVLEVIGGVGGSLGGVLGAVLIDRLGIEPALILTGLVLPVVAGVAWPWVRRLDRDTVVPERQAQLLRGLPLFRPLSLTALEFLAFGMRPVRYETGEPLMTEGEPGDSYVVIESGRVEVTAAGVVLGQEGPGQGVGEIALLKDVPRTATVRAIEPVVAWVVDRTTFLEAVTGHEGSSAAAHAVADGRLARGGVGPGLAPLPPDRTPDA